jgi:hypothetical protein
MDGSQYQSIDNDASSEQAYYGSDREDSTVVSMMIRRLVEAIEISHQTMISQHLEVNRMHLETNGALGDILNESNKSSNVTHQHLLDLKHQMFETKQEMINFKDEMKESINDLKFPLYLSSVLGAIAIGVSVWHKL